MGVVITAKKMTKTAKLRRTVMQQFYRMRKQGFDLDDALKADIKNANYNRLKSFQSNRYEKFKTYNPPSEGELIFSRLSGLIQEYPREGSMYVGEMLDYEIAKYGLNKVMQALSEVPEDALAAIQEVIYYDKKGEDAHRAIKELAEMIKGSILNEEEAKELGDAMDGIDTFDEP